MAFIRWKKNRFGIRQAYLVYSYRDKDGMPRHRTLAYLGATGEISASRIPELERKHQDLAIPWHEITGKPYPNVDIQARNLSDAELLTQLSLLRKNRGYSLLALAAAIRERGIMAVESAHGEEAVTARALGRWETLFRLREISDESPVGKRLVPVLRQLL